MDMTLRSFLSQGGPVMYVLLGMSIIALAIVLLKLVQFALIGVRRTGFADAAHGLLENGDVSGALQHLEGRRNPVAAVMERAILLGRDPSVTRGDTEAEIGRIGSAKIRDMESWLRGLSAIAHLSPLLGLLGTVIGMIEAFMQIERVGSRVDPAVLSGGIWEALLTTAFGLSIAIPAMAAYFYLEGEVDRTRSAMKDAVVRVLVHFGKGGTIVDPSLLEEKRADDAGHSYGV